MGRSRSTFSKRENEKKKQKKKEDKQQKREEKKANNDSKSMDDMIAYVDEFGNISDTPPDPDKKKKEVKAANIEISIPKKEEDDQDSTKEGVVSFYDHSKNFGFIQGPENDRYFVHESNVLEPIQEGDKVSFVPRKGLKGMDATEVKPI
ncbi:MAG: cold-shock protein [Bacteroidota bacterium]